MLPGERAPVAYGYDKTSRPPGDAQSGSPGPPDFKPDPACGQEVGVDAPNEEFPEPADDLLTIPGQFGLFSRCALLPHLGPQLIAQAELQAFDHGPSLSFCQLFEVVKDQ